MMQAPFLSPRLRAGQTKSYRVFMTKLLDVQAIRHANLLLLLQELGLRRGAAAALSRLSGVPQPYISQLKLASAHSSGATRTMGDDTARALEVGMGKPNGWMDHDHRPGSSDRGRRLAALYDNLPPAQGEILMQMAQTLIDSLGKGSPDDGPELREPRHPNKH